VQVTDFGAGSIHLKSSLRTLSDITKISCSPHKLSSLYSRIIAHFKFVDIVELGTSIGLNTAYLATAHDKVRVHTLEGSDALAAIANSFFAEKRINNVKLIQGNIDDTLEPFISTVDKVDFALIDANHRFDPTVRYLELLERKIHPHSIIAIDDIHYSREMEKAWQKIQNHNTVSTTIDLYRCGLAFFDPSLTKQNVVLQF
jgi:predicted O-methyltransferase YrrM